MGECTGDVKGDFCSFSRSAGVVELTLFRWERGEDSLWMADDRGRRGRLLEMAEAGTEAVRSVARTRKDKSHTQTTSFVQCSGYFSVSCPDYAVI